jgi:hypothetical protein
MLSGQGSLLRDVKPGLRAGDALVALPWLLLAGAVVMVVVGMVPFAPDSCANVGLSRGAVGWAGVRASAWPPGTTCVLELANGQNTAVVSSSWLPVLGTAVAVGVMVVGFLRPPHRGWRAAAQVSALLSAIACLLVLGVFGHAPLADVGFGAGVHLFLALVPAALTTVAVLAWKERPVVRVFAMALLAWATGFVGVAVVSSLL